MSEWEHLYHGDDRARRPSDERADPGTGLAPGKLTLLDGVSALAGLARIGVPGRHVPSYALPTVGRPAPDALRQRVEAVTGADLSDVQLHDGPDAAAAAEAMRARAFTIGRSVYFGRGELAPGTPGGDELLAHELGHAAQHRGALPTRLALGDADDRAEHEADAIAHAAVALGNPARVAATAAAPAVRMVRMTGEQAKGFIELNDEFSADVFLQRECDDAFFERELAGDSPQAKLLEEIKTHVEALKLLMGKLDLLTTDEETELPPSSTQVDPVEAAIGALRTPLSKTAKAMRALKSLPDDKRGEALKQAIEEVADIADKIRPRAARAEQRGATLQRKLDNEDALKQLHHRAGKVFRRNHAKDHDLRVAVNGKTTAFPIGNIDQSLSDLASRGRLAELVDAIGLLFNTCDKGKSESGFDPGLFGIFQKDKLDELVATALHNIAHPETIFQGKHDTCAAAVLEMLLAIEEPAKYLELLTLVASGKAEIALGNERLRSPGKPGKDDASLRNAASQLMQPALMEAMRPGEHYDATSDRFLQSNGKADHGVSDENFVDGSRRLLDKPLVKAGERPGNRVGTEPQVATVRGRTGSHELIVLHDDGQFVYFLNPQWGRMEKMTLAGWGQLSVQLFRASGSEHLKAFDNEMLEANRSWTEVQSEDVA